MHVSGFGVKGVLGGYEFLTTKWFRRSSGILFKKGSRISESSRVASGSVALVKGIARVRPFRGA